MISKKYIILLGFKTIDDIYSYIVDSEINGNYGQFKELINKLSKIQFKGFLNYLNFNSLGSAEDCENFKNKVLNARLGI